MANISGITNQNGIPTECTVRIYRRDSGVLVAEQQSVGGSYSINGLSLDIEYDVLCIGDDTVCPQVNGTIYPKLIYPYSTTWRLFITANVGHTNTTIVDLRMKDDLNVLLDYSSATISSSTQFSAAYQAEYAVDQNSDTRWASDNTNTFPQWLEIEFPTAQEVSAFSIEGFGGTSGIDNPRDFELQYHDGTNWIAAGTFTNEIGWTGGEIREFQL